MSFWREVFSDGGSGSASRVLTAVHVVTACWCLGYVTHHNHVLPDAVTMGGLGAFSTIHYMVNATKNAITSFSSGNGQKGGPNAPNPST
jgi:hypothetical protein